MFTHWTDTLYICLSDDGHMSLKILNIGDSGCGETFKSKATKEVSVLYEQIEDLCYEKGWETEEILKSLPNDDGNLRDLLRDEQKRVVAERKITEETNSEETYRQFAPRKNKQ